jgi:class 3 adenylate cyclase
MTQELPEGTVTIVFTDVVGSTDLTTALGVYRRHLQLETKYVQRIHGVLLLNAELDSLAT